MYRDVCNYIMKKHMMKKHKYINKCALCGIMFKEETLLKVKIEKEYTNSDNIVSDKDMVTRMEQLQRDC